MKKSLVIALFLPLLFGCSQTPQEKSRSQFDAGVRQLDEFAWDDALESFKESGESDLTSPRGMYGEGLVLERKLQYLDALAVYMAITQTQPEFAEAHAGMSRMLSRLGLYDEAVLEAVDYLKNAQESDSASMFWADALIASGETGRSRREIIKAYDGKSIPAEIQLVIASTFLSEQKRDSANTYLANAYADYEPSSTFYRRAADYFELAGLLDSSMMLSRLSVESSSNDYEVLMAHFDRCLRSHYFYDARKVITDLWKRGAGDDVKRALETTYFLATNERTRALRAGERLRAAHDDLVQPVYYEMQANAALNNGMAISQDAEILRRTLKQRGFNLSFLAYIDYLLIMTLSRQDTPLETLEDLEKLPAITARKREVALARLHMLFDSGQQDKAVAMIEQLYKLHRNDATWLTGFGDGYYYSNYRHTEWKKSEDYYNQALLVNESDQHALTRLINMYRQVGRTEDALKAFEDHPAFARDYARFAVLKSYCLVENGDFMEGIELFKKSMPAIKGDRNAYVEMLDLLDSADKQTELLDIVEFSLKLNPQNVDMLVLAAKAFSERGQFERAGELAGDGYDLEPGNVFCSVQKAVAMYGQNRVDEAFKLLEETYAANRFVSDVSYHLSRMLSLEERDPLRAEDLARISVGMSYMAYKPWMNLCFAYYQGGRFDLARGEAIKASHKFKKSPLPLYWMGMAKYREGNKEAKEDFQKAIDLGLRNEELAEARRILTQLSN